PGLKSLTRALSRASSLVAAVVLVAACGGAGAKTVVSGDDVRVLMFDDRFQYTEIHIPVGGSVEWVGAGRNPHNAVAADGSWSTESVFGSPPGLVVGQGVGVLLYPPRQRRRGGDGWGAGRRG
ncbi:MAG: hypothetical protein ACRDVL_02080, partial [Acidimicrobiia bacterium]